MTTYLSRPVFPFELDWDSAPTRTFSYDLAPIVIGQANARFQPTANELVTGFEFEVLIEDKFALAAWDTFFDACRGKLNGFWFIGQDLEFKIASQVNGTTLRITRQRAADGALAGKYAIFRKSGQSDQYAKISTIARVGDQDQVTLESSVTVDSSWEAYRLYYCRLANDDNTVNFEIDNTARLKLRLIELTEEYISVETGQQPVFLYDLWFADGGTWRFTSLNQQVICEGNSYNAFQIGHDGHSQTIKGGENSLTIKTIYDAASPVVKLFPFQAPNPLSVRVWETTFGNTNVRKVVFTGIVEKVRLNGQKADLTCSTMINAMGKQFPRFFIQNRCNYAMFSTECGVFDGPWQVPALVCDVGARNLVLMIFSDPQQNEYYCFGLLRWRGGVNGFEYRTIESASQSNNLLMLTLTQPLRNCKAGDIVDIWTGCDGTAQTCHERYNNLARWGGHNLVRKNLAVNAVANKNDTGNKK